MKKGMVSNEERRGKTYQRQYEIDSFETSIFINITVWAGGCGITDVPRRNIADTPQSKYVPIVQGAEIKGGARRPAEP